MFAILVEVLLPIAFVAAMGFLLRRNLVIDLGTLNRVMMYGLSPALIFVSLVRTEIAGGDAVRMISLSMGVVVVLGVIVWAIARSLGLRGPDMSAVLLAILFMNTGNYGLPAARFAFGEAGLNQALLYFIAQSIMAQTLGVAVAAAGSVSSPERMLREVGARLLRMPAIYAVAAALFIRFSGLDLAQIGGVVTGLWHGAELFAEAALPMMLMILGMQLAEGGEPDDPKLIGFTTAMRLIVSPLIGFGLGWMLGLRGIPLAVGILLAGMPTAVNTTITALEFNSRPRLVVSTVILSSLLSLGSLTVILWLVR